ncbi:MULTISPECIES: LysR family transcriptional regulator [unclassified Mesorhizobium]|uniref:LysR family transcriptional regulator n=1 Tax=unclassified Mesorhizobium TaxID=325217 RepID=UPI00112D8CC0|nr:MULTISPECIES: LysR family transcriptional regulator [unclassified Mesorhizobium]MBZ9918042.1 LysR family transcriptional regulator [Mesorhizobium sp. BR1-1-7]MBZ9956248.1 LysR family transcriptional regulator [Mesorhizobium sp. BR1-1-15]MBZ9961935.1 LysR family transcriptional regulator [Mesorhizobium sp. BR1-1-14]MBZ9973226.1 LysR family transcriptional regulator [Mesorhizobium sp. BR1-1-12]MCA0056587.1 LysR family transcriptional regulator [Mesorhizobium sp. B261B1A]
MDFEAIDYFIKVAEAQSLSHAAKLYGLPKSSLSHKVRALEDSLGVALFVRDGRELHLSDAGAEFLDHAQRIKESCEGAKAAIAEAGHDIAGTLTIGSTGEFGTSFTSELLFAFRQQYPQVNVDVIFLSLGYFLAPEKHQPFDGIFHWGEPANSDYIARKLGEASFCLYASPRYIEQFGEPSTPADLAGHGAVAFRRPSGVQSWHLERGAETVDFMPTAQCMANDYWMLKYFAVAGEGIVYLPAFFTEIECKNGDLVPVLPQWRSPLVPINLLYMRRRYVSRKFAVFLDFCLDYYRQRAAYSSPRYCVEVVRPFAGARAGGENNR